MIIDIPGRLKIDIRYIVFDFNGTIAVDGIISENIRKKIKLLSKKFTLYVLTSDTYGTAKKECEGLPVILKTFIGAASIQKSLILNELGSKYCACFGNGYNDINMLECSGLSIAVLSKEGMCSQLVTRADILVNDICDGIDLFLKPVRIIADLRN